MPTSEDQAAKVGVWVQLGASLVLVGFTTYLKVRALMSAEGVPDTDMAKADAEYASRIARARQEQQQG